MELFELAEVKWKQHLLQNLQDNSWQRGPGGSGEAEAEKVEKAQGDRNSHFRRNRQWTSGNSIAYALGSKGCWGENPPHI